MRLPKRNQLKERIRTSELEKGRLFFIKMNRLDVNRGVMCKGLRCFFIYCPNIRNVRKKLGGNFKFNAINLSDAKHH